MDTLAEVAGKKDKAKYIGRVRLIQRIGHGSMGVVYRGYHEELSREVAIKILGNRHDDTQRRLLRRFQREGKAASTVRHPNVVRVFESDVYHGRPYIVMELIDGASLGDILDQKGSLPWRQVLPIGVAIAEGLTAIHQAGIIHRDIKPDNILLGADGSVKITDLGLARYLEDPDVNRLTSTGVVVGTPLYVAPESIKDTLTSGPEADVYSLGATLYHAIAGQPVFDGESPYDLMRLHLQDEPPEIDGLIEDVPPSLGRAIMACLAKDPAERPGARELVRMLAGKRPERRHPVRDLVLATCLAIVVMAIGLWFLLSLVGGGDVRLTIEGLPANARWRLDGGSWHREFDRAVTVLAGRRRLEVEAHLPDGRLMTGSYPVDLEAGEEYALAPAANLSMVTVDQSLTDLPGEGLIFCHGRSVGLAEPVVRFAAAGRYHVSRWDGSTSHSTVVTVTPAGVAVGEWRSGSDPSPEAYFRLTDRGDLRYHLVTVQELRYAATATGSKALNALPAVDDPVLAATELTATAVRDWAKWRHDQGVRLPRRREAEKLSASLRMPVWYAAEDLPRCFGDPTETGSLLVALPGEEDAP